MDGKKCNSLSHYSPFILWRNYVIGILPLVLVPVFVFVLPFGICQFLTLAMAFALYALVQRHPPSRFESCTNIPFTAAREMFDLPVVYVVIDLDLHELPDELVMP